MDRVTTKNLGDQVTTKNPGDRITTKNLGDQVTTKNPGDRITTKNLGDQVTTKNLGDRITTKNLGDRITTKNLGEAGEARAWQHLLDRGLVLVERNYRVAAGPRARGGEIDLIARDRDGTLVFVEVRMRGNSRFGGAAGSVSMSKRRSLVLAARHYLGRFASPPPCRFDVVAIEGDRIDWLRAAFDAD